jgi:hypothetical protein
MDEVGNLDSLQKVDSRELELGKTLVENLTHFRKSRYHKRNHDETDRKRV